MGVIITDEVETRDGLVSAGTHLTELRCPSCRERWPDHTRDCAFFPADETKAFDYDGDWAVAVR